METLRGCFDAQIPLGDCLTMLRNQMPWWTGWAIVAFLPAMLGVLIVSAVLVAGFEFLIGRPLAKALRWLGGKLGIRFSPSFLDLD